VLQGGADAGGPLSAEEMSRLQADVAAFVKDRQNDQVVLNLGGSMLRIRAALDIFKTMCRGMPAAGAGAVPRISGGDGVWAAGPKAAEPLEGVQEEVKKLRLQIQQRDNEINILVSMLKKRGGVISTAAPPLSLPAPGTRSGC